MNIIISFHIKIVLVAKAIPKHRTIIIVKVPVVAVEVRPVISANPKERNPICS